MHTAKQKTKDTDYLYSSARIKALERRLITRERLQAVAEAKTDETAVKLLMECGFPELVSAAPADVERALAAKREDAFALIRSLVTDERISDVFLLKNDYHNVKTILKGEAAEVPYERLLVDSGRIPASRMQLSLRDESYAGLSPTLARAAAQARDVISRTKDAQLLDFILDRAMYEEMLSLAEAVGAPYFTDYIRLMIDGVNLRSALRLTRMGKGTDTLRLALIPGGTIAVEPLLGGFTPEVAERVYAATKFAAAAEIAKAALAGNAPLSALDRACDNVLVEHLKRAKYVAFGIEPIIGYLAAREAELTAVRIVMSARSAGLDSERIMERLMDSYV